MFIFLLLKEIQVCINLLLYQDLNIQHSQQFVVFIAMLLWVCTVSIPALNCSEESFFGSLYPFLYVYILYIFVWSKGHWQPVSITFGCGCVMFFFCWSALSSLVDYQWGFKIVLKDVWMEVNRNWFMPIFLCFKAIYWKQKEVVMIKCS